MAEFDVDAFLERFRSRAEAVKERGIPPLEGTARRRFIEQAELDFPAFSLVAGANFGDQSYSLFVEAVVE